MANILFFLLFTQILQAAPQLSDFKTWKVVSSENLEIRADDYTPVFLGTITDFQNPNNLNEFVRIYSRQVVIVAQRARERRSESGSPDQTEGDLNYHLSQQQKALERVHKEMDTFAYVYYKLTKSGERKIMDGPARAGLLDERGNWRVVEVESLPAIRYSPYSLKLDSGKPTLAGFRFTLDGIEHIIRADHRDLKPPPVIKTPASKESKK